MPDAKSLEAPESDEEKRIERARKEMIGVSGMVNLDDFEVRTTPLG